jgi:hypothetical protein
VMVIRLLLRTKCADVCCAVAPYRPAFRSVAGPLSRFVLCGILAGAALVGGAMTARPARADEFSMVPAGDPLYRYLMAVTEAGWRGVPQGSSSTLTRYEMALETAKAIFTVTARQQASKTWALSAPKPALRALRELTNEFRVELKTLGVDVAAAQQMYSGLLRPSSASAPLPVAASSGNTRLEQLPAESAASSMTVASAGIALDEPSGPAASGTQRTREFQIPLSQRLRINTALSVLARDAEDLFGDSALGVRHMDAPGAQRSTLADGALPAGGTVQANMDVGVTDWLTLRAGYGRRALAPQPMSLESLALKDPSLPLIGQQNSMSGGVDVAVRPGVRLSGNVENIETDTAAGSREWTRVGGGLALSAWQNRLSLKANMSRLVPEDARVLPSTIGGLNVNLDVTERLSLTLLYQQLFSAPNPARPDRLVAGGININF